jgi:hypothetical protein
MSLLARFEEVAELLFTGMFKKNNTIRLQPVEIAKGLVKVMFKNKQVSISQVYVPNVYRVFLFPRFDILPFLFLPSLTPNFSLNPKRHKS